MQILRELIAKEEGNIVKLAVVIMVKLRDMYPGLRDQGALVLRELLVSQQDLLKKQLEETNLDMIILSAKKLNQMMSSITLVQLVDSAQV
jgi:hypothetical protein